MSTPLRIELFEVDRGDYCVIVGDMIAKSLSRDEALGVIAAAIYNPEKMPPYLTRICNRAQYYGRKDQ
jgi:hypothetical protein